jgi:hypothetical protein
MTSSSHSTIENVISDAEILALASEYGVDTTATTGVVGAYFEVNVGIPGAEVEGAAFVGLDHHRQ